MSDAPQMPRGALAQMGMLVALSVVGLAILLGLAWNVVESVKGDGVTFEKMAQGKDLVADVLPPPAYLLELHDSALHLLAGEDATISSSARTVACKAMADFEERHTIWSKADLPKTVLEKERAAYEAGHTFAQLFDSRLLPLLAAGDHEGARRAFTLELQPAYDRHRSAVDLLVRETRAYNAQIAALAKDQESSGKTLLVVFCACFSTLLAIWGVVLSRRLAAERQLEKQQLESEEQYRFALEAANMGAWDWDIRAGTVHWSDGVEAMFGLERGKFEGSYAAYLKLIHPDDRTLVEKTIASAVGGSKDSYLIEHRVQFSDGSIHWIEGKGRVFKDAQGTPERMRGTVADITSLKQVAQERDQLEAQLRQSQRMEAVGKLAGGVAHDFNNILTSIMGYNELARRDLVSHPAIKRLEGIQKAAERAASLTRQLLAFSRKQVLQPEFLDVKEVIRDLHGMLERLLGSNIMLHVEYAPELPLVKADRGQIEQVVMNLVVNARDAMPGGGTIRISARKIDRAAVRAQWGAVEGSGNVLELAVSDDGTGMPSDVKANLFQPYFTTKPEGKGTGLGLSTVYGIVQQSGGAIGLDAEPGQGSTFRIYLPAVEDRAQITPKKIKQEHSNQVKGTLLVAEDQAPIAELIKSGLEHHGFVVMHAENADAALKIIHEFAGPIDLLLTDILMPGKSGRVLAESAVVLRPDMKVLFMSGYAADEAMRKTLERLGAGLINKPFTQEALYQVVCETLQREAIKN